MQRFNKDKAKKIFAHTWYIYPIMIALTTLIWMWGFEAFHQPTAHQSLTIFFSTQVKNSSFATKIRKEHYEKENLREIKTPNALPSATGYYSKLKLYMNNSDILVLDEATMDEFKGYQERFFVDITTDVKTSYFPNQNEYYVYEDEDHNTFTYGALIKKKGESSYFDEFMTFMDGVDYYACLSVSSKNLGAISGERNAKYDNALTFMNYLLEA